MTIPLRHILTLAVALLLVFPAAGADDRDVIFPGGSSAPTATSAASGKGALDSVSLVAGLLLAAAGGWLFWRNRRRLPAARDGRSLAIVETRSLGNRQYLVVASHEGKRFLLGVCPGQISFLSALPDAGRESGGK